MTFASRDGGSLRREELDDIVKSLLFKNIFDLLSDAIIIVDLEGNVAFINRSAEKLSGAKRAEVVSHSFEKFLRTSNLEMDEWLATAAKSRGDGLIRSRKTGDLIPARHRLIAVDGYRRGFELITLHIRPDQMAPADQKSNGDQEESELIFSPHLEDQIKKSIRAYKKGVRVLLLGESGVGKTVVARYIHSQAARASAAFVHVNCGSITESLFESEMFGYQRGAFTGALQAGKKGFVEAAKGGTLFLDEIGEIPLPSQAKLLKFLEDGTIQPVGSIMSKRIATTVITATNRDLRQMVDDGRFRRDLFYRVATFPCTIPPLRDRSDKATLINAFVDRVNHKRKPKLKLSQACREKLLAEPFLGNLRELRSIIEFLDIVADEVATPDHLQSDILAVISGHETGDSGTLFPMKFDMPLKDQVRNFERTVIKKTLASSRSKRQAAEKLSIDIATLIRKQRRGDPSTE